MAVMDLHCHFLICNHLYTLKNAGLFQPKFGSKIYKPSSLTHCLGLSIFDPNLGWKTQYFCEISTVLCFPSFYKGFVLFFTCHLKSSSKAPVSLNQPEKVLIPQLNHSASISLCVQHHYHIENIVCLLSGLDEVLSC